MPSYGEAKRKANARYRSKRSIDLAKDQRLVLIRFHLPASLSGRIQRLYDEALARGTHAWRNRSQVYQDLIRRGFLSLKDEPIVEESRAYLEARSILDARRMQRLECQALFQQVREDIEELLAENETDVATQHFVTAIEAARRMSPTVWRDWLIRKLKETYPTLAQARASGVRFSGRRKA